VISNGILGLEDTSVLSVSDERPSVDLLTESG